MAKNMSYLDNLKKEISDKSKASDKLSAAKYKSTYGTMGIKNPADRVAASKAAKANDKALGQLFGAIFMGARYDDKTGKRISGKKK
jgi:hypothetical protein